MRVRYPKVAKGTAIGIREAARKYGIDHALIVRWAAKDREAVLKPAGGPGDFVLIDEAWLQARLRDYEPHRDNAIRRNRLGRTLVATRPLAPQSALANGNGHSHSGLIGRALPQKGDTPTKQGSTPLLSAREWVDRFYAEQMRAMGGAIRPETKKSYDMIFKDPRRFLATFITLPMERHVIMEYLHGMKNHGKGIQNGRPLSPGAKRLHHRVLSTFYAWLGREHGYPVPDLSHSNLPASSAEKAAYTPEEIRQMLGQVRDASEYTIVLTLAQTGCRRGELCSLTIENLHDHWALAIGKPTRANKTGERVLYLADECYEALRKHLTLFGRMTWRGDPLNEIRLSAFIRWLQKQVGIYERGQNSHAFRRAYEAEFIRNGGSELFLDEILGHRKVDMRSLYFNAPKPDVVEQARRYAPRRFLQMELVNTAALPGLDAPREGMPA